MTDKLKKARTGFEAAMVLVTLLGGIGFVALLWIGYIATGGTSVGGFIRWLFDGLGALSG